MSLGGLYLEGPIHGRAYFRNFTVCQNRSFYFSWCQRLLVLMTFHPPFYKLHTCVRVSLLCGRPLFDWYFSSTWVDAWNRVEMSLDVMLNPHFVLHENTSQFSMGIKQLIRHLLELFYWTIPISALKHKYQLCSMAITLRKPWTAVLSSLDSSAWHSPRQEVSVVIIDPQVSMAATARVIWLYTCVR